MCKAISNKFFFIIKASGLRDNNLSINALLMNIQDIIPLQFLLTICPFDNIKVYGKVRRKMNKSTTTLLYRGYINFIRISISIKWYIELNKFKLIIT